VILCVLLDAQTGDYYVSRTQAAGGAWSTDTTKDLRRATLFRVTHCPRRGLVCDPPMPSGMSLWPYYTPVAVELLRRGSDTP
jgi:hypothetical protein